METTWPGVGILLLTFFILLATVGGVTYGLLERRPRLVRGGVIAGGAWLVLYLVALVAASLTSEDRSVGWHRAKHFCGFYLDCHISVSVESVTTTPTIGEGEGRLTANGVYHVVTLRYGSNAIRARLSTGRPDAVVRDAEGRVYRRMREAEEAIEHAGQMPRMLAPGEFATTHVVFDLPAGVPEPRLYVRSGFWIDRLVELVLVGDEDSLLHGRTWFRLRDAA